MISTLEVLEVLEPLRGRCAASKPQRSQGVGRPLDENWHVGDYLLRPNMGECL